MLRNLHRHSAGLVKPIMRTYLTQVSIADARECRIIGDRFVWADGWVWDVQEGIWTRGGLLRRTSRWLAGSKGSICNNKELELRMSMSFRRYITFAENCAGLNWEHLTLSIAKGVLKTYLKRIAKNLRPCLFGLHPIGLSLFDYKAIWLQSNLDFIQLDYKDYFNCTTSLFGLHPQIDYIRSDYFGLFNVFFHKKAWKYPGSSKYIN